MSAFLSLPPTGLNGLQIDEVMCGRYFTCARVHDGTMRCWGHDAAGQLGNGPPMADSWVPVTTIISGVVAGTLREGSYHAGAIGAGGVLYMWGENTDNELGNGNSSRLDTPAPNGLQNVSLFTAGDVHSCALTTDSGMKCWGRNEFGQLGDGTTGNQSLPADVVWP
jgi:alpha-tubulin suppressor-like RCC1 family protein